MIFRLTFKIIVASIIAGLYFTIDLLSKGFILDIETMGNTFLAFFFTLGLCSINMETDYKTLDKKLENIRKSKDSSFVRTEIMKLINKSTKEKNLLNYERENIMKKRNELFEKINRVSNSRIKVSTNTQTLDIYKKQAEGLKDRTDDIDDKLIECKQELKTLELEKKAIDKKMVGIKKERKVIDKVKHKYIKL